MFTVLKVTKQYRIKGYSKSVCVNYRHKLLSMGMLPGAVFSVVRYAPLGDTLQIEVNDFSLSLRSKELQCLQLEECEV